MAVGMMVRALAIPPEALATREKFLLVALANYVNPDGCNAWPSVATMARRISMSPRMVQRLLKRLIDGGWITVTKPATAKLPTTYCLNLAKLPTSGSDHDDPPPSRGDSLVT